jgi:hypothetical protein
LHPERMQKWFLAEAVSEGGHQTAIGDG